MAMVYNDNVKFITGCGEEHFFTNSRNGNMWFRLHKKKCEECKQSYEVNANIVAKDITSNRNNHNSFAELAEAVDKTIALSRQIAD